MIKLRNKMIVSSYLGQNSEYKWWSSDIALHLAKVAQFMNIFICTHSLNQAIRLQKRAI